MLLRASTFEVAVTKRPGALCAVALEMGVHGVPTDTLTAAPYGPERDPPAIPLFESLPARQSIRGVVGPSVRRPSLRGRALTRRPPSTIRPSPPSSWRRRRPTPGCLADRCRRSAVAGASRGPFGQRSGADRRSRSAIEWAGSARPRRRRRSRPATRVGARRTGSSGGSKPENAAVRVSGSDSREPEDPGATDPD